MRATDGHFLLSLQHKNPIQSNEKGKKKEKKAFKIEKSKHQQFELTKTCTLLTIPETEETQQEKKDYIKGNKRKVETRI
jgi:hypothetical protein